MKLTKAKKAHLMDLLALIGERDMPSNNTEQRLIERSGLGEATVAWCIAVIWNEDTGWAEYDEHPQTGERGYYLGERFDAGGGLDKLFAAYQAKIKRVGEMAVTADDEDDEDEWAEID